MQLNMISTLITHLQMLVNQITTVIAVVHMLLNVIPTLITRFQVLVNEFLTVIAVFHMLLNIIPTLICAPNKKSKNKSFAKLQ